MTRFKQWLFERFFPAYIDESYSEAVLSLRRENSRLRAYIKGMETAIRNQRRIDIRNEVKCDGCHSRRANGKHNAEST